MNNSLATLSPQWQGAIWMIVIVVIVGVVVWLLRRDRSNDQDPEFFD